MPEDSLQKLFYQIKDYMNEIEHLPNFMLIPPHSDKEDPEEFIKTIEALKKWLEIQTLFKVRLRKYLKYQSGLPVSKNEMFITNMNNSFPEHVIKNMMTVEGSKIYSEYVSNYLEAKREFELFGV